MKTNLMKLLGRTTPLVALMLICSSLTSWATTYVWNCSAVTPTSGSDVNVVSVAFSSTQGNNNGTVALISTSSASSGYTGASGTSNFGAACFTGALNTSSSTYFSVTLTPATGYAITLTSISFGARSTPTGPTVFTVYSSIDNYGTAIGSTTGSANSTWALKTISFSGGSLSGAANAAVTLRIYGSGGTGSPGAGTANWRIDDINLVVSSTGAASAPSVSSSAATSVGTTTATLNGNVTADGGASVTDRGFCYKTTSGVTIADNKTASGSGTGAFTLSPTLSVNTHYYFVAYAINSAGTSLSTPELNFWTLANTPSAPTVNGPTPSSLNVAIGSGDANPATTVYAIHETTQDKFVQADGSLGASAIYQTAATWSTKTVTGLAPSTSYTFEVKAQNGASVDTGYGASASAPTSSASTPAVTLTGGPLSFGGVEQNAITTPQSVTVSGANLTADITVSAPAGFEISLASGSGFGSSPITLTQSGGIVAATTVYVRFSPVAVQAYSGNLSAASTGATPQTTALSGTGVYSASSDIIADTGFTYPQNISYGSYQETDLTSSSLAVAQFIIRDGGASADADSASTTLTDISFTVANSANLRRVALYEGTTELGEVAAGSTVAFSSLNVTASDDGTKTLTLRASFQTAVTDNQQFSFTVSSATAGAAGSVFAAANAGGAVSSTANNDNRIAVTATKLALLSVPTSVVPGANFSVTVQAQDANGNVDADNTDSVTLSKASGSGTLSSVTGLTQNLASGAKTWADVQIDAAGTFSIQAAGGSLTSATSGSIVATTLLLVEDFAYPATDNLTSHGWSAHSGAGTSSIKVTSPGLSYSGYLSSGVGLAAALPGVSGEDDHKDFTSSQTSGSVYAAFMVNASASTTAGDYFFHLYESSSFFHGRIYVKKDASSSNFAFGLSKVSEGATYTGFNYTPNTTYLVVLKYTFNPSTQDDTVALFVNPVLTASEPTPVIGPLTAANADATTLVAAALRQGGSSSAPNVVVDGIRVGKSWSDVAEVQAVAPDKTVFRTPGLSTKIHIANELGANAPVQSVGSGSQSATITFDGTYIYYLPQAGNNNGDQFTYTVANAVSTATGNITITMTQPTGQSGIAYSSGGQFVVRFAGIPGYSYTVQRSDDSSFASPSDVLTTNAPAAGVFYYSEPATSGSAYFRLKAN